MADARAPKVKNRAPAPVQITAEQLLREAQERQETGVAAPRQKVEDFEELHEYRGRKRKEFEEVIRRTRQDLRAWTKYGTWEASQSEFARARSVFERALDVAPTSEKLWLSYCEMELKARNIQHARNLFDRAVTLLPRINQIWYKYVYLEELLGNISGARQVFERWMSWEPDEKAWSAYIKMEVRYQELDRASTLYERMIACHPDPKNWIKWAKFEEERQKIERSREIFQMAFEYFGEEEDDLERAQSIYTSFAKMESRHKEYDRARMIYKYALDRLPRSKSVGLYASYTNFEKQFGDRAGIEATVLGKRRIQYEEELANGGQLNYDVWFEYARLEENALKSCDHDDPQQAITRIREVYERAIAQVPPSDDKRYWRRYIFLWLGYATFEETETKDAERVRQVYEACLKLIPHKRFTFAKVWDMYAHFELRQLNLDKARKIMGTAIGLAPKPKSFKVYLDMELQLREFDRCRKLYEKFLEFDPTYPSAWIQFAGLERGLMEVDRARAIYEMAISQNDLYDPECVWKAYIDFEEEEEEWDRARKLFERLALASGHVKVWTSWAKVNREKVPVEKDEKAAEEARLEGIRLAREVLKRGYEDIRKRWKNEIEGPRSIILDHWKLLELEIGDPGSMAKVEAMIPRPMRKWRKVEGTGDKEEYWDLVFPDDEKERNPGTFKLVEMAHAWKAKQLELQQVKETEQQKMMPTITITADSPVSDP
ncbi:uncharacterized protein MELLADRAFT_43256 [Melampsora larici-populina 98AG31]|uniref:Pre-mRNA-splicing factor Syf1-like N-terminal HAT-repeats domain-containing protein n=1 Tax=Melampsora larici-populina (strain 98AG31 / pathotype 3-4-7) TaxID=747676 RepID=F4RK88_MELLP|nr:uncharacterized protein MELLADRAFT_43256 [Melampsora larici-populina 98AG31]EGG07224.1 hypothetical protein MELLADRAFT_43256 [Melampsora larici-populina 98AG31]